MSARLRVREGEAARQPDADAVVLPAEEGGGLEPGAAAADEAASGGDAARLTIRAAAAPGDEASLRSALRAALALAATRGARRVAVAPLGEAPHGLPLRRRAELLLEQTRACLEEGGLQLEEICFAVPGEPAYRLFESVDDATRVAAQIRRLTERRGRS